MSERLDWMLSGAMLGCVVALIAVFLLIGRAENNAVDHERLSRVWAMCMSASEEFSLTCNEFRRYWYGRYPDKGK